jgi:pimeloyl-ACP methyl ester carboxylesterase
MSTRSAARLAAALLAVAGLLAAAPVASAGGGHDHGRPHHKLTPMIFVHGGAGSGAQFESQALRFRSNGYPASHIRVLEYDSLFGVETMDEVRARLDALIAEVKAEHGVSKVDVLGHSLGTTIMHGYLATPERAANVRKYVNIDGRTSATPPGGVPTLAIWAGRGTPGREIGGAVNVTIPNQTHVEVATSKESFVPMYEFFTGREPRHDIVREHHIKLSGRAQLFPQNTGVGERTLEIWRVNGGTGQRQGRRPEATLDIAEDGSWGPVRGLRSGRHYEFALLSEGSTTHHLYFEPFKRSDHLVRLLTSEAGGGVNQLIERSPRHTALTILRYKEFWGDQGEESDVLEINGTNVLNAATAPITKRAIGLFAFDVGSDGASNVGAPIPVLFSIPFLTGVDLYLPAAAPPIGKVSLALTSRGEGRPRVLNVPNFPSSTDSVSVSFWDYEPKRHHGPRWRWR